MAQKPEKITRKAMKRRLPKTSSMSATTLAIERGGGASAAWGGSLKKIVVATSRPRLVSEDITST